MSSTSELVVAAGAGLLHAAQHSEHDTMRYYFDNEGDYLVAATHTTCYMVKLDPHEVEHVHTNTGMEDLQLRMVHEWLGVLTEVKVYHGDSHLPTNIQHWCSKHDIYVLDRPPAASTVATTRTAI